MQVEFCDNPITAFMIAQQMQPYFQTQLDAGTLPPGTIGLMDQMLTVMQDPTSGCDLVGENLDLLEAAAALTPAPTPTPDPYARLGSRAAQARGLAEPILAAISNVPPDFQDDFATEKAGWEWWSGGGENQGTLEIRGGVLRISDLVGNLFLEHDSLRRSDDFVLELDARVLQGDLSVLQRLEFRHANPFFFSLDMRTNGS